MKRAHTVQSGLAVALLMGSRLLADMGTFPVVNGAIHEEEQTAVILMDTEKKRETIILQTNVRSDQDRVAVFFMPLPAKPDVQLAPADAVKRTLGLVKQKGLTCTRLLTTLRPFLMTIGGGDSLPRPRPGIGVVFHKRIGKHQVTTVELTDLANFRAWSASFLARNRVSATFDFEKLEAVVKEYFRDGHRFFLFDLISLSKVTTTMRPLAISFASERIYYPLRVNRLYTGKSDVLLMVFSDVSLPRGRFSQIGFAPSKSVRIQADDRRLLGPELNRLLPEGPLQFQCFLLQDPRSMFRYLQGGRNGTGDLELYARLHREAIARWAHDVHLSLSWGRRHAPDYRVSSPEDMLYRVFGIEL